MIKLKFLHISDYALFAHDDKLTISGIFHKVQVKELPATIPIFTITTGITGDAGKHKQVIEIYKPDGQLLIASDKTELEIKEGAQAHFLAAFVGVSVPVLGAYRVRVKVGENYIDNDDNVLMVEMAPAAPTAQ